MTTEQKAKAYDDALKRAINLHKDAVEMDNHNISKICEIIFPELKESEDERVRKELISLVENWKVYSPNSPFADNPIYTSDINEIDKILAWLEKQKPTTLSKSEDVRIRGVMNSLPKIWNLDEK